jgi:hypothetical protein
VTEGERRAWQLPPRTVVLVAVLLLACAEVGGAAMARFKVDLARWARGVMLARPDVHGLTGVRDVDEPLLDEALVKFDAGLRLFHLHAEGMGLVILAVSSVISSYVRARAVRGALLGLVTAGGAVYPVGYLVWSACIPFRGIEAGKRLAEWGVWIPFGTAVIVGMWWLTGLLASKLVRR